MTDNILTAFSEGLADAVAAASPSVVQVHGARRAASGVVFAADAIVTTGRAIRTENGVRVRTPDGRMLDAELAGWDPVTHLAVLRVPELNIAAASPAPVRPRVGHVVLAIGRSWSNGVTATTGNVAIIGGPLPTGRGRAIEEVIRITAPMHQGFAGGAVVTTAGQVLGIATAAEIRGLGVVIPATIAWKAAEDVLAHGQVKRGYLGLMSQVVRLSNRQRGATGPETALLVTGLTPDGPAERAGVLVGDIVTTFDGVMVDSTDRLLELLIGDRVGSTVSLGGVRGDGPLSLTVTVAERV